MKKLLFLTTLFLTLLSTHSIAQNNVKKYTIAGIEVEGTKYFQAPPIIRTTGLYVGQQISVPGPEITYAIENYGNKECLPMQKSLLQKSKATTSI